MTANTTTERPLTWATAGPKVGFKISGGYYEQDAYDRPTGRVPIDLERGVGGGDPVDDWSRVIAGTEDEAGCQGKLPRGQVLSREAEGVQVADIIRKCKVFMMRVGCHDAGRGRTTRGFFFRKSARRRISLYGAVPGRPICPDRIREESTRRQGSFGRREWIGRNR